MKHFVKVRIWDFILCLLCQTGLVFNVFSGFLLEDSLYSNVILVILIMAVLDVIYFLFSYNRKLMIIGIIIAVLAFAAYIYYAASSGIFENESAHSIGITFAVTVFVSLAVYLLGRTKAGIVVLFIIGNFIIIGCYFLQYPVELWTFLIFEVAAFLFFLYRCYCLTTMKVYAGRVKFPVFILQFLH